MGKQEGKRAGGFTTFSLFTLPRKQSVRNERLTSQLLGKNNLAAAI